jgi:hypothetical protein
MDIKKTLATLNEELKQSGKTYELYCCGGAALQLLGIISRETADLDVIVAEVDRELIEAKNRVARKLRIDENWLNNKVSPILERLPADWKKNCTEVFSASHLVIHSLSRQDLINSKLHAAIDRHAQDYDDLALLAPTVEELAKAKKYALKQQEGMETYEVFVDAVLTQLKKDLGIRE